MNNLQQDLNFEAQRIERARAYAANEAFAAKHCRTEKQSVNWGPIAFALVVIAFFAWQIVPFMV